MNNYFNKKNIYIIFIRILNVFVFVFKYEFFFLSWIYYLLDSDKVVYMGLVVNRRKKFVGY